MLDIGLSELALIAIVALVILGPEDMMRGMRYIMEIVKQLRSASIAARAQMREVIEETGLEDLANQTRTIIDLEGKPQIAYDVSELGALSAPKKEIPHDPA